MIIQHRSLALGINLVLSTYVSLLNAGLEIFRCFRHWSPYASMMFGPQNLFRNMDEVS